MVYSVSKPFVFWLNLLIYLGSPCELNRREGGSEDLSTNYRSCGTAKMKKKRMWGLAKRANVLDIFTSCIAIITIYLVPIHSPFIRYKGISALSLAGTASFMLIHTINLSKYVHCVHIIPLSSKLTRVIVAWISIAFVIFQPHVWSQILSVP